MRYRSNPPIEYQTIGYYAAALVDNPGCTRLHIVSYLEPGAFRFALSSTPDDLPHPWTLCRRVKILGTPHLLPDVNPLWMDGCYYCRVALKRKLPKTECCECSMPGATYYANEDYYHQWCYENDQRMLRKHVQNMRLRADALLMLDETKDIIQAIVAGKGDIADEEQFRQRWATRLATYGISFPEETPPSSE